MIGQDRYIFQCQKEVAIRSVLSTRHFLVLHGVFLEVVVERKRKKKKKTEQEIPVEQARFKPERSTRDQVTKL